MIRLLKIIATGFFIAVVRRGIFILIENFNKKTFAEMFDIFFNKNEIILETISIIIIYCIFVWILKKI